MNRLTQLNRMPKWLIRLLLCMWLSGGAPGYAASEIDQSVSLDRIETLLGKAEAALKENRLTVPSGNNAVGYAQQVLNLAPNHPEAQRILQAVVARYETLGNASLDRAEAVWKAEIDKAQAYQQRGSTVARNYRIPDNALAKVEERITHARKSRSGAPTEMTAGRTAESKQVAEIIERYLDLSEQASSQNALAEAESHLSVSRDLLARNTLAEIDRDRLSRRVLNVDRELASRKTENAAASSAVSRAAEGARYVRREPPFFMPPSF
jgi:hypothetical protein